MGTVEPNPVGRQTTDDCPLECHYIISMRLREAPRVMWPSPIVVTSAGVRSLQLWKKENTFLYFMAPIEVDIPFAYEALPENSMISFFFWNSKTWTNSIRFCDGAKHSRQANLTCLSIHNTDVNYFVKTSIIPLDSYKGQFKIPKMLGNSCAERKRVKVVVHKRGLSVLLPGDSMSSVCSCCICVWRRHMYLMIRSRTSVPSVHCEIFYSF